MPIVNGRYVYSDALASEANKVSSASRIAEIKGGRSQGQETAPNAFAEAAERALQSVEASQQTMSNVSGKIGDLAAKTESLVNRILPEIQDIANQQKIYAGEQSAAGKDLLAQGKARIAAYDEKYGGLEDRVAQLAEEGLTADYEGVTGRAATDVSSAFNVAKQNQLRQMQEVGVNPNAGLYGSMTRNMNMEEAKAKALAVNQARTGEKRRVEDQNFDRAATGLNLGQNILNQGVNMETAGAGVMRGAGDSMSAAANSFSGLSGAYAPAMGAYGQLSSSVGQQANTGLAVFDRTSQLASDQAAAEQERADRDADTAAAEQEKVNYKNAKLARLTAPMIYRGV